jgi:hypothetical protein
MTDERVPEAEPASARRSYTMTDERVPEAGGRLGEEVV